jgi:hypothetical protein
MIQFPTNMFKQVISTAAISAAFLTLPIHAVQVAFFSNGSFNDTSWEAPNLNAAITSLGHSTTSFSGTTQANFANALAGADVLVIPELEIGNLNAALSAGAKTEITNFVNGGGGIVVVGDGAGRSIALLNSLFGYSLTHNTFVAGGSTVLNAIAATATSFAGGPATLPNSDGTELLNTVSLPGSALAIYTNGPQTTVFVNDQGAGYAAFLGFDWFASPTPTSWNTVLHSALTYQNASVPEGSSTLLLAGIAGLGLFACRSLAAGTGNNWAAKPANSRRCMAGAVR